MHRTAQINSMCVSISVMVDTSQDRRLAVALHYHEKDQPRTKTPLEVVFNLAGSSKAQTTCYNFVSNTSQSCKTTCANFVSNTSQSCKTVGCGTLELIAELIPERDVATDEAIAMCCFSHVDSDMNLARLVADYVDVKHVMRKCDILTIKAQIGYDMKYDE